MLPRIVFFLDTHELLKWREDEEEDVRNYWMNLRERGDSEKLKQETLDRDLWRIRCEKGYRSVVRQTTAERT